MLEQIRARLIQAVRESGLTQIEIAKRLNINSATISHYVKGDKMPALDTFANLCKVLDLDANEILCISD